MHIPMTTLARTAGVLALAVAFVTPSALADDTKQPNPPTPPAKERQNGGPGLSGPKVPAEGVKGNDNFDGKAKAKAARQSKVAPAVWFATLKQLTLTDAQKLEIEPMVAEWNQREAEFRKEFAPKIKELEEKRKAEIKEGGKPTPETVKALEEQLANRPKAEPVQEKIFAKLTAEQQKEFKEKLEGAMKRKRDGAGSGGDKPGDAPTGDDRSKRQRERNSTGAGGKGTGTGTGTGGGATPPRG